MSNITLSIDGKAISIGDGATVLEAAGQAGINIPTLCHIQGLGSTSCCMVCAVKNTVSGRLIPACSTRATQGMDILTNIHDIQTTRTAALELILSEHYGDCSAPCQRGCPAHMNIPGMIRQIQNGDFTGAMITVKQDIPFPSITGRICPAPCEKTCKRTHGDGALSICLLKRFVGDLDLESIKPWLPQCQLPSGKNIAIVGAGVTGLTAAWYLQLKGHKCSIYDKAPIAGGALTSCVDPDLLPPEVLRCECSLVEKLGVKFNLGTNIEGSKGIERLRYDHNAVILATGRRSHKDFFNRANEDQTHTTGADGQTQPDNNLFIGGSALKRCSMAVQGIAEGKRLAHSVDGFLTRGAIPQKTKPFYSRCAKPSLLELFRRKKLSSFSTRVETIHTSSGSKSLTPQQAQSEAQRCFNCDCISQHNCRLRNVCSSDNINQKLSPDLLPEFEQIKVGVNITFEPGKCIKCGACVAISERHNEPVGFAFINRGIELHIGASIDGKDAEALTVSAAACASACPTGALAITKQGIHNS